MELDKIRNLSDGELTAEEHKAAEQLFRLRFQMKLGQTEGVKKLKGLRKDIARIKTIARERELGVHGAEHKAESSAPARRKPAKKAAKKPTHTAVPKKAAKAPAAKKPARKTKAAKSAATKKEAR
jgi:large subunit ribosomal protein L29